MHVREERLSTVGGCLLCTACVVVVVVDLPFVFCFGCGCAAGDLALASVVFVVLVALLGLEDLLRFQRP